MSENTEPTAQSQAATQNKHVQTTGQAPAGWFPVDGTHERYWDGQAWADSTRRLSTPKVTRSLAQAGAPVGVGAGKAPWFKRGWVLAVTGLLVGIMLGAASSGESDPTTTDEFKAVSGELEAANAELETTKDELATTESDLEDIAGDLPAREDALKEAEAALDEREAQIKADEADVQSDQKALAARERKVGIAEATIANNTIPGDGVFEVGRDMKAGSYRTQGANGCYYAVNADANGNNIKSNNITDGPATVSVSGGEFFETRGCDDWVLQP